MHPENSLPTLFKHYMPKKWSEEGLTSLPFSYTAVYPETQPALVTTSLPPSLQQLALGTKDDDRGKSTGLTALNTQNVNFHLVYKRQELDT